MGVYSKIENEAPIHAEFEVLPTSQKLIFQPN